MTPFNGLYRNRRVLITGHTGFKGSWLTTWLLDMGAIVCGLSKDIPTDPSLFALAGLEKEIEHHVGDVRDYERVKEVIQSFRPDFVFHLAAQPIVSRSYKEPLETITTNVVGTSCVLQALSSVDWPCTALIITSDKCYENVEWPWGYRETDHLGGKDIYSGSKGAAEVIFHAYHCSFFQGKDHPVRLASARAGNVIGGGDWAADRIVVDCIRAWMEGRPVQLRSPAATRPWQHVLEPLSGYLTLGLALHNAAPLDGEAFNFGPRSEQNRTVVELLSDLSKIWGFDNVDRAYQVIDNVPFHEAGLLKLNCDKALMHLRWEPNLFYDECVKLTGDWYRAVLREGQDVRALTAGQIRTYQDLAATRARIWAEP